MGHRSFFSPILISAALLVSAAMLILAFAPVFKCSMHWSHVCPNCGDSVRVTGLKRWKVNREWAQLREKVWEAQLLSEQQKEESKRRGLVCHDP